MASPISNSLFLIIQTIGSLFLLAVVLRFLLQIVRADFYNPVSQAIVKITNPILIPLRRIIPSIGGLDTASLLLAFLIQAVALVVGGILFGVKFPIANIIVYSFLGIIAFMLNVYFYALIISIIASWIVPQSHNPFLLLCRQLLEPINSRLRQILPPMGGLDFSPIFIILGIQICQQFIYTAGLPKLLLTLRFGF